jgi:hypothetical protein
MSRCDDDCWWWVLILALFCLSSQPTVYVCSDRDRSCWSPPTPTPTRADAGPRRARTPRRPFAWLLSAFTVIGLFAAFYPAPVAPPANAQEGASRESVPPPPAIDVEPVPVTSPPAEPVVDRPPIEADAPPEPPPLLDAAARDAAIIVVPEIDPVMSSMRWFDVGSVRADVLAAQGSPPTYTAHHDRTLWWGSSKVSFTHDGYVDSWRQGTPALSVRRP